MHLVPSSTPAPFRSDYSTTSSHTHSHHALTSPFLGPTYSNHPTFYQGHSFFNYRPKPTPSKNLRYPDNGSTPAFST
jgi:hypothetical protein